MAFPTIASVTASQQTSNGTTSTVTLPGTFSAGDLFIAVIGADSGASTFTWPAGWTELIDSQSATGISVTVGYRIAQAGDTAPGVTHTSERSNHFLIRVTGWHGTTAPEISTLATGSSTSPNPPSLSPSWGSADTLWIPISFNDDSAAPTYTGYPTANNNNQNGTATSAARIAMCSDTVAAASYDAGAFTLSGTETWGALTVAVRPTSGTAYTKDLGGGTLSFSGSLTKQDNKPLAGALSFSGAISKQTAKPLAGVLSFAGSIAKRAAKPLAGALSFSGALMTSRVFLKDLTGTLSFAGSLTKQAGKSLAGSISPAGALTRQTNKALAGVLSFSGALTKRTARALAGALSFSGALTKRAGKALAGALSFSGALSRQAGKALAGALSFSGTIAKSTSRSLAGSLSFSGSLAKQTARALLGALSFAGNLVGNYIPGGSNQYFQNFTATLSFSGSLSTRLTQFFRTDALNFPKFNVRYPWYRRGLRKRR